MGGREGNPDPALQTFVTGVFAPSAEGETAFLRRTFLRFFFFVCILAFLALCCDNEIRKNISREI